MSHSTQQGCVCLPTSLVLCFRGSTALGLSAEQAADHRFFLGKKLHVQGVRFYAFSSQQWQSSVAAFNLALSLPRRSTLLQSSPSAQGLQKAAVPVWKGNMRLWFEFVWLSSKCCVAAGWHSAEQKQRCAALGTVVVMMRGSTEWAPWEWWHAGCVHVLTHPLGSLLTGRKAQLWLKARQEQECTETLVPLHRGRQGSTCLWLH